VVPMEAYVYSCTLHNETLQGDVNIYMRPDMRKERSQVEPKIKQAVEQSMHR